MYKALKREDMFVKVGKKKMLASMVMREFMIIGKTKMKKLETRSERREIRKQK